MAADDVLLRLGAIERRLSQLERGRAFSQDDDAELLARLLPVIGGAFGSKLFTLKDLLDARGQSAALRLVVDRSASSLGQLFARHHGRPVAGFVIQKVGCTGSRAVWKVSQVEPTNLPDRLVRARRRP